MEIYVAAADVLAGEGRVQAATGDEYNTDAARLQP
jgi:hypothetical protein